MSDDLSTPTPTRGLSRRHFLGMGLLAGGIVAAGAGSKVAPAGPAPDECTVDTCQSEPMAGMMSGMMGDEHGEHGDHTGTVGDADLSQFDPTAYLSAFDWGKESTLPGGRTLREWEITAGNHDIEVAPGVWYPGWAYNRQVPGPTLRCREGDRLRIRFGNGSSHAHTIHFHGIHPPSMDGSMAMVEPGQEFVYEFDAQPFGLHLYHCHTMPIKRHIHKGLYGTFIVDPPGGRPPAREMVMMMNAFDTNFDNENEVYCVNTVAFHYARHPIQVKVGEPLRVYLVNITEFDLINSFHLHAGMFRLYRTGTNLEHYDYTDTVMMCQGERHVLEFSLPYPGQYMFHAHQSEFAELGWMGFFEAKE